jgi:hypothetical protein
MRVALLGLVLVGAGCARTSPHPLVPPETQYTAGGTLAAVGGTAGMIAAAEMTDRDRSPGTRKAGMAAGAAGAALLAAAVVEAIEVEREREKFYRLQAAFWRNWLGSPSPDAPFRDPAPPLPEVPFNFEKDDGPLSGQRPD